MTSSTHTTTVFRTSALNPDVKYPIFPPEENLRYRLSLFKKCEEDHDFAQKVKAFCAQDIVFWVDNTCWTKDTRNKKTPILPFICYDFQVKALRKIKQNIQIGKDLLIEKSRDMGASWMIDYVYQHEFQFEIGADFRMGSRKEEFVDKLNDINTLLEKIRFNLERQPLFLMPVKGFETVREFGDSTRYMRLINKENQNSIVGESANPHFGSGGRSKSAAYDEMAKWEKGVDVQAWTASADLTPCRIVISTPVGSANKFAMLAKGKEEKIEVLTLHWTIHPLKNKGAYYLSEGQKISIDLTKDPEAAFKLWISMGRPSKVIRSPWYDAEDERRTEADLAQEVDIDYKKSGSMFFNAEALSRQKAWQYMERKTALSAIPYGFYITGRLVEVQNQIKFLEEKDGWLEIYELPKPGHQYTLAADSSEGLEKGDNSSVVLIDKSSLNVQAVIDYKKAPEDFAKDAQLLAWYFNECDAAPENNNHGHTTAYEIEKLSHVKLYYAKRKNSEGNLIPTGKRGFTTTGENRRPMLDHMAHVIEKNAIELRSEKLITQCETFVRNNDRGGEPEADGTFLDDLVIATAIALRVTGEIPFKPGISSFLTQQQREAVSKRTQTNQNAFGYKRK